MDKVSEQNPGRARTALLRVGLRLAGAAWEDGDEENGECYGMRAIPWRQWEAYGVAIWIGVYAAGVSLWGLDQMVVAGGWMFWVLVPVALLVGFLGLQAMMVAGAILVWLMRRIWQRGEIREVNWVSGVFLIGLTVTAVLLCVCGGVLGWVVGMLGLVPVALNGLAWIAERVLGE